MARTTSLSSRVAFGTKSAGQSVRNQQ